MTSIERHFNLLEEPWLPVRMKDGEVQWLGLLQVFRRSADIQALAETRPPSLVAEYRLLLAILHRALVAAVGRWQDEERVRWYQDGLPLDAVCIYLEKWRHAFWLFDPERPFLQVAALATADETCDRKKPWTQISLASANGNMPVVFDHALDQAPATITLRDAVSHLLGFLQFTPGGLVKVLRDADKAGALVNTAAVLPVDGSLAQTLVLALHPAPLPDQLSNDLPSWERPALTIASLKSEPRLPTGPNDRYTRQSRAVLLCLEPSADGVRMLWFAAGEALGEDPQQPDPMACFREGSAGLIRVSFTEGRAVWRDLPALVPTPQDGGKAYKAAATVSSAESLLKRLGKSRRHQPLLVAGLTSDQAKLLRWRVEQFELPTALLTNPERALELKSHLALCETVHGQLRYLAGELQATVLPDPSSKDTKSRALALIDNGPLSSRYFAAAERRLCALMEFVGRDASDEADLFWQQGLHQAALDAWQRVVDTLGMSADALRAEARCRRRLLAALREHLPLTAPPALTPRAEGAPA
jgi:CRISPR system Cascade subunit CasA